MDFRKMTRSAEAIQAAVKEYNNDLVAVKTISAVFPERYIGGFLGSIEEDIRVLGIFSLVLEEEGFYANSLYTSYVITEPTTMNIIKVDEEKYIKLTFKPGDKIIKGLDLIRVKTLVFRTYKEFIASGRIPPYLNLEDVATLLSEVGPQANVNLGVDNAILEIFAAAIARNPKDRMTYFRHLTGKDREQYPDFIPLNSVAYGASNTTAKIIGADFGEGLTSALVRPSERLEGLESLLRK